ncbi:transposase, partial [candidate division MSBL1 archaeon SCGC-AAA259M10]
MYDVLDLYQEPYDPKRPVVGVDERPKQLIGEKKKPIPMKPGSPEKVDYEYVRNGSVNVFVAVDHKGGKRDAKVTDRRTKKDFATYIKRLIDKVFLDAEVVRLVVDNLNTHNGSSFYETFDKAEAERILSKIEFHYTPIHGSW